MKCCIAVMFYLTQNLNVNFANCYFTGSLKVKTFLAGSFREQVKEIYVCGRERNRFELKNWVCCTLKRKFVAHSLKNAPTNGCFKSALTPKLISNKNISDLSFQKRNSSQKKYSCPGPVELSLSNFFVETCSLFY